MHLLRHPFLPALKGPGARARQMPACYDLMRKCNAIETEQRNSLRSRAQNCSDTWARTADASKWREDETEWVEPRLEPAPV